MDRRRQPPGAGTTVKVYLPRTDAPVSGEELPAARIVSARGETVLIVEDQDTVRQLAAKVLKQHGYCTIEAASGSEAVLLLQRPGTTIDLLLTDVILPGINGRELADRIRSQIPTVKVLFMSGYAGDELGRRGRPGGRPGVSPEAVHRRRLSSTRSGRFWHPSDEPDFSLLIQPRSGVTRGLKRPVATGRYPLISVARAAGPQERRCRTLHQRVVKPCEEEHDDLIDELARH